MSVVPQPWPQPAPQVAGAVAAMCRGGRGLPETRLGHLDVACAVDLIGLRACWTGTPLGRRRASHLARLGLGPAA